MIQVSPEEAQQRLLDLLKAAMSGEQVVIAVDDKHSVRLVAATSIRGKRQFGSAKGLIEMAEDFDEPLADFEEYMR